jgi:hypothetical protein
MPYTHEWDEAKTIPKALFQKVRRPRRGRN